MITAPQIPSRSGCSNCIINACWMNDPNLNDIDIRQMLGQGAQGMTMAGCRGNTCNLAVKVSVLNAAPVSLLANVDCASWLLDIPLVKSFLRVRERLRFLRFVRTPADFEQEVKIATKAGELGIGPKVLYSKVCAGGLSNPQFGSFDVGILVMERMDMTLISFAFKHPDKYKARFRDLLKQARKIGSKADKHGLHHEDLHANNIMMKGTKLKIIDWGINDGHRISTEREMVHRVLELGDAIGVKPRL
jgi:hypothetical protein